VLAKLAAIARTKPKNPSDQQGRSGGESCAGNDESGQRGARLRRRLHGSALTADGRRRREGLACRARAGRAVALSRGADHPTRRLTPACREIHARELYLRLHQELPYQESHTVETDQGRGAQGRLSTRIAADDLRRARSQRKSCGQGRSDHQGNREAEARPRTIAICGRDERGNMFYSSR